MVHTVSNRRFLEHRLRACRSTYTAPGCEIRSLHEQVEAGLEMTTFAGIMQGLFIVLNEIGLIIILHQLKSLFFKKQFTESFTEIPAPLNNRIEQISVLPTVAAE